jgi:hypothetical protein
VLLSADAYEAVDGSGVLARFRAMVRGRHNRAIKLQNFFKASYFEARGNVSCVYVPI